jgi:hypothetical protein
VASYLMAAGCVWAAWRLGLDYLPPRYALLSALSLDGLLYLTGDAAELNNNIALNFAWALAVLFFVRAVRTGQAIDWLALGTAVGVGLWCKYTLGVLAAVMAGYLIFDRNGRRHLLSPGPYWAALLAGAVFLPHAVWMAEHDFQTLRYAAERSSSGGTGWARHVNNPAMFVVGQLVKLLPVLAILIPVIGLRSTAVSLDGSTAAPSPTDAERTLLRWVVIGPIALLLILSLATGCQLRDIWGSSLFTFAGVWLLVEGGVFSPARLRLSARLWGVVAVGMWTLWSVKNIAYPYVYLRPTRVNYPGRPLADEIARRWHVRRDEPFAIVAGEGWRASLVCCYAPHRPMVYSAGRMGELAFDPKTVFWTSDGDFASRGGVIVWDAADLGDELPDSVRRRFPGAETQPPIVLPYQTGAAVPPDRVGVAFVWPNLCAGSTQIDEFAGGAGGRRVR